MAELSSTNATPIDADQQSTSLQALLFTLILTPFLILPEPVRNIVSVEATVAAVTIGVIAGIVMSFVPDRVQFESPSDVRTTIAAFMSIGVATVLLWVLIPADLFQTASHFGLAFIWSFSIVSVIRDIIWPKTTEMVTTHE